VEKLAISWGYVKSKGLRKKVKRDEHRGVRRSSKHFKGEIPETRIKEN
jgi:hypothetical protein